MAHEVFGRPLYRWLLENRKSTDPVELVVEVRQNLGGLADTAALFRASDVVDEHGQRSLIGHGHRAIRLLGSWPAPDRFDSARHQRFVNPDHEHADYYTDCRVECDCGAEMVRSNGTGAATTESEEHSGCTRADRLRASARLHEKRAAVLGECMWYGLRGKDVYARLGLGTKSGHTIGHLSEAMNLPTERWREEAAERRTNTEAALIALGYPTDTVGSVWGVSASTVRERIARKTDWGVRELRGAETPGEYSGYQQ
mgnify:CR=1 FL=1